MRVCDMRILAGRVAAQSLAVLITVAGLSGIASAQQIQAGATSELLGFFVRGVDSAFDPNTRTYMVVGGAGTLLGVCINEQGVPVSNPILLNNTNYGAFPRVQYGAGAFLVVWPEEVGPPSHPSELHSLMVTCAGPISGEQVVSADATAWLESGAAIAYSPTSQRFLAAWKSFPLVASPARVKATLINLAGTQFGPVVDLSAGFGRDPGVAWNPYNDSFGVSFSGETGPNGSTGFSGFSVVPAANPAAFSRLSFNTIPGGLVTISDVDFNPHTGRYVMTWFELSSGLYTRIAEFDAAGNLTSSGIASGLLGSYDALSIALNPVTGTFALVGLDRRNDNVLGLELNTRGFPFNGENTLSAVPRSPFRPGRYTRVSASTTSPTFNSTYSIGFGSLGSFIASSSYSGSLGPPGSFDAPPPAPAPTPNPTPTPSACPGAAPVSNWVCVNGGWLPPDHPLAGGAVQPTPAPTPTPAPAPTGCLGAAPVSNWVCVNGGWLPPDHPLAIGAAPTPAPTPTPTPTPAPAPTGCIGGAPVSNWVCVNGGWLPPDHPLAVGYTPAPAPAPSSCTTPQPGANWYCVNGGWVPPNSPLAPGGACVGAAPSAGWVCTASGGWVPPNHPLAGGGGD